MHTTIQHLSAAMLVFAHLHGKRAPVLVAVASKALLHIRDDVLHRYHGPVRREQPLERHIDLRNALAAIPLVHHCSFPQCGEQQLELHWHT